ncbi:MAG TPA: hypothetical protein VF163_09100 [Micromonosporaceae bacterium]
MIFALTWFIFPGFGLADLMVTISPTPGWVMYSVLEAGWGLLATMFISAAFMAAAIRPQWTYEIAVQVVAVAAALAAAAVAASEPRLWWFVAGLIAQLGLLVWLARISGRPWSDATAEATLWSGDAWSRWPMLVMVALGAGPWLVYAVDMFAANRAGLGPVDLTVGVNHWAVQGALALSLILLSVTSIKRPPLRRFSAVRVGLAAAYLGLCSLRQPDAGAALPAMWSVAAIVWGAAVVMAAWLASRPAR